ncbi:MAG: DUF5991 domain-containing protein [Bacteroidota bacterium]|nr:DUF5991 domain-containing protein [Candidatus Kapabacteria bacterium]MDW8219661.1 DUF5991 domain-containing protein [Bacteroidota bacterium]
MFTVSGCRKKRGSQSNYELGIGTAPTSVWVGYFRFDEYGGGDIGEANPTAVFVGHLLTVRQSGDSLRANLSANGPQYSSELLCTVLEVDDTLKVFFQDYGANHSTAIGGTYTPGAHLLSLVRSKYTVLTWWYAYKPVYIPLKPERQGGVWFMKENEDDIPNVDIEDFPTYWAEYTKALATKDSMRIAYMTAFPLVGSNYARPEGALTDIVSKSDFMTNYRVVLFPALYSTLQTKRAEDFRVGKKTKEHSVFLPNGLVPVGVELYRLLISSQELEQSTEKLRNASQELSKEQTEILQRNNKIAKELQAEYKWAIYVARLQGRYRVCYIGVAPKDDQ